jgi:hypothetical protein
MGDRPGKESRHRRLVEQIDEGRMDVAITLLGVTRDYCGTRLHTAL